MISSLSYLLKKHRPVLRLICVAFLLFGMISGLAPIPALASPPPAQGGLTLEWLEGTNATLDGSKMTMTPVYNSGPNTVKLKLTLTLPGSDQVIYPAKSVKIDLPGYFSMRSSNGKPYYIPSGSLNQIPLKYQAVSPNTAFGYTFDREELTLFDYNYKSFSFINYEAVTGNTTFSVELQFIVGGFNDCVDMKFYDTSATAVFKAEGGTETSLNSAPLQLRFSVDRYIDKTSPYTFKRVYYDNGIYTAYHYWNPDWGTEPASVKYPTETDFFYLLYYTNAHVKGYERSLHSMIEINNAAPAYGEVVGYSYFAGAYMQVKNLDQFNEAFANKESFSSVYILMRYPKSLLSAPDANGYRRVTVYNELKAELIGRDEPVPPGVKAKDEHTIKGSYTYTLKDYQYPGDAFTNFDLGQWPPRKTALFSTEKGFLNLLEKYKDDPAKLPELTSYDLGIPLLAYNQTLVDGQYLKKDYTLQVTDQTLSLKNSNGDILPLNSGDYSFNYVNVYDVKLFSLQSSITGITPYSPQLDYNASGRIELEYTTDKINYLPLGYVNFRYNNKSLVLERFYADNSPEPSRFNLPPGGALGLRFKTSNRSLGLFLGLSLSGFRLNPSERVLNFIKDASYINLVNEAKAEVLNSNLTIMLPQTLTLTRMPAEPATIMKFVSNNTNNAEGYHELNYTVLVSQTLTAPYNADKYYTLKEIEDLGILTPFKHGIIHDLLPLGLHAIPGSVSLTDSVYKPYPITINVIPNWRGSGRDMLEIRFDRLDSDPPNLKYENVYGSGFSGAFSTHANLRYKVRVDQNTLNDYGLSYENHVAFESLDAVRRGAYPDNAATLSEAVKPLLSNLRAVGSPAENRFLYARTDIQLFNLLGASQAGFTKGVKAAEDPSYAFSASVLQGGSYLYRLRNQNNDGEASKGLVFYDNLEDQTEAGGWHGSFQGINLAQPLSKGVLPEVYYAKQFVDVENTPELRDLTKAPWVKLEASTDLSLVKALAIDLSKRASAEYELPPLGSLVVEIQMKAPDNIVPFRDHLTAKNRAFILSSLKTGLEFAPPSLRLAGVVSVSLPPIPLALEKSADPASATLKSNDSLTYTLKITNNSTLQALSSFVFEDPLPQGFEPDTANLKARFGSDLLFIPLQQFGDPNHLTFALNNGTLSFTLDKLLPGQSVLVQIPGKILPSDSAGELVNQAKIVSVQDSDYPVPSNSVTHSFIPPTKGSIQITALKTLTGANLKANQFTFELRDDKGALIESVQNDGDGNVRFSAIPIKLAGEYVYTLSEQKPALPGFSHDPAVYTLTYTFTADAHLDLSGGFTKLQKDGVELDLTQTPNFENHYKKVEFSPVSLSFSLEKELLGKSLQGNDFSFVLKDIKGNPIQSVQNDKDGKIRFAPRVFSKPGLYLFTVSEVKDQKPGIVYDERVIRVRAYVEEAGSELSARAVYLMDELQTSRPLFQNRFVPPKTGDKALVPALLLLVAGFIGLIGVRRRKRSEV